MIKNLLVFLTQYKAKKAQLDKATKELEAMKIELMHHMALTQKPDENGKMTMVCGQYTVTITPCKREGIDEKRLKSELPEIAKQYEKTTEYERVNVK